MPRYIRNYVAGGTYFLTLVTHERRPMFNSELSIQKFFDGVDKVQNYHPFDLLAYCVLPDHIHLLLKLPYGDCDYSTRIKEIKRKTTLLIRNSQKEPNLTVWQNRFWEHTIRDLEDLQNHADYIHYNPVKHGYCGNLKDWKWSSIQMCDNPGREVDPKVFLKSKFTFGE